MRYEIDAPHVPPSTNDFHGRHAMTQYKWKQAQRHDIHCLMHEHGKPKIPGGNRKVRVGATLYFPVNARRDQANYFATTYKGFADQLVVEGIVPDDTAEHVECTLPVLALDPRGRGHTVYWVEVLE